MKNVNKNNALFKVVASEIKAFCKSDAMLVKARKIRQLQSNYDKVKARLITINSNGLGSYDDKFVKFVEEHNRTHNEFIEAIETSLKQDIANYGEAVLNFIKDNICEICTLKAECFPDDYEPLDKHNIMMQFFGRHVILNKILLYWRIGILNAIPK